MSTQSRIIFPPLNGWVMGLAGETSINLEVRIIRQHSYFLSVTIMYSSCSFGDEKSVVHLRPSLGLCLGLCGIFLP